MCYCYKKHNFHLANFDLKIWFFRWLWVVNKWRLSLTFSLYLSLPCCCQCKFKRYIAKQTNSKTEETIPLWCQPAFLTTCRLFFVSLSMWQATNHMIRSFFLFHFLKSASCYGCWLDTWSVFFSLSMWEATNHMILFFFLFHFLKSACHYDCWVDAWSAFFSFLFRCISKNNRT